MVKPLWCVAALLATPGPGVANAQGNHASLDGAWTVASESFVRPDTTVRMAVKPAMLFFSGRYVSALLQSVYATRRPTLPENREPTTAQKARAFDTIVGFVGTFDVHGDSITLRPTLSVDPRDKTATFGFRLQNDTLWVIATGVPWPKGSTRKGELRIGFVRAR
jgi:hypothetical protein